MEKEKYYGKENESYLKLMIALSRSTNSVNKKLSELFRRHHLTMMQFAVLEVLYHKGDLIIKEIMEKILATGGNMTVVLQNLSRDGYIEKCADSQDSRASLIKITQKGTQLLEQVFPEHLEILEHQFSVLEPDEIRELTRLLRKLGA